MKMKTCGVYIGLLGMGMAVMGIPPARAQNRMETSGVTIASAAPPASEPAAAPAPTPAPTPAELDKRIEALEQELAELRGELETRKKTEESAAAVATPVQPAPAPQETKEPAKTTIASLLGPTSLSGFIDVYWNYNANHPTPSNILSGGLGQEVNGFRAFDTNSNQFALNMVELILDKPPDASASGAGRTGYHVALGFGQAMNAVNGAEPVANRLGFGDGFFAQNLKEAYFSYVAPVGKGLQVDVGKYVTPMGAEVIETKDNWNYSRGLLFTYAIPFFHFGARSKYTFNDKYSLTGYLANGSNSIVDNNSGKMYGLTFGWNPTKKISFAQTYMAAPETTIGAFGPNLNVNDYWRQTWDSVLSYNATSKLSFLANFDYGRGDRTVLDSEATPPTLSDPVYWTGIAGYLKYAFNDNNYLAARYEYFEDHDGFVTGTGIPRLHFNEVTATYQRTLATHLLTRFEYRRDISNQPVFLKVTRSVFAQDTATLGLIFLFDSRDAK
jgi:hypothetical protein